MSKQGTYNRSPSTIEEYEMVDVQHNTHYNSSLNSNESREVLLDESDTESVSSRVFEQLEISTTETQKPGDGDGNNGTKNFHDDVVFQGVFAEYMGRGSSGKSRCLLISAAAFIAWLMLLVIYSNGKFQDVRSNLRWHTTIQLGGENVSLNPYSVSNNNLTMNYLRNGRLSPMFADIHWLNEDQVPVGEKASAGHYLERAGRGLYLLKKYGYEESETFMGTEQFSYSNNFFYINKLILNPAMAINDANVYHLVRSDVLSQWRHSSFALYWLFRPSTNEYAPIQPPPKANQKRGDTLTKLHFAEFSPDGTKVVFGVDHDLYIQDLADLKVDTITSNGSPDIFNGKPDWVYEEEILSSDRMVWWSPKSDRIVYGSVNDTGVLEYDINYYVKDGNDIGMTYETDNSASEVDGVNQYPVKKTIKYPKPGTKTPRLSLYSYDVKGKKSEQVDIKSQWSDYILYDASWIDDDHFMVKITDSTSSIQSKKVVPIKDGKWEEVKEIQTVDAASFGGWFDKYSSITRVEKGYVDKVVYNNRTHLAYYDTPLSTTPKMLTTSKDWDILESAPVIYDGTEKVVYTLSNIKGPMDAHLMAIDLEGKVQFVLADEEEGLFEFKAENKGRFITLSYLGPDIPWQKTINTGELHVQENFNDYLKKLPMVSEYKRAQEEAQKVNLPTKVFKTVNIDSIEVSVLEILPPNFNPKAKYPLLVNAYGGPGSQIVSKSCNFGFEDVVSAQLNAIVLQIDPRGTNGRGWNYKTFGLKNIGHWEPRDITTITSEYVKKNKKLVDKNAVAIWGWSYGAFTALKTLELDQGKTFKYGMAVAPVSNFLFYNSFYTERYMKKPSDNSNYKTQSLITDTKAFQKVERFLLMHGTADDNVHIQNSMWLLDKFNADGTENYDVHFFADNDHGITYHNSDVIVYDKLLHWLQDAFMYKFVDFV